MYLREVNSPMLPRAGFTVIGALIRNAGGAKAEGTKKGDRVSGCCGGIGFAASDVNNVDKW
jgi:hypothetical protein